MKNISNNKLAILGISSFLISMGFEQMGFEILQAIAIFGFGFCFGMIFHKDKMFK